MLSFQIITSSLNLPKASHLSLWKRAYAGFLPSCLHYSVFNAVFFGTFGLFWDLNNRDYVRDHGFSHSVSHQRESVFEDVQPVHYDLLGRSIICLTCGYTLAQLICYPFGVYRNMKYFWNLWLIVEWPIHLMQTLFLHYIAKWILLRHSSQNQIVLFFMEVSGPASVGLSLVARWVLPLARRYWPRILEINIISFVCLFVCTLFYCEWEYNRNRWAVKSTLILITHILIDVRS